MTPKQFSTIVLVAAGLTIPTQGTLYFETYEKTNVSGGDIPDAGVLAQRSDLSLASCGGWCMKVNCTRYSFAKATAGNPRVGMCKIGNGLNVTSSVQSSSSIYTIFTSEANSTEHFATVFHVWVPCKTWIA
jgi:hypothetical protein